MFDIGSAGESGAEQTMCMWDGCEGLPQVYRFMRGLLRFQVGHKRGWRRFDGAGLMALPRVPAVVRAE